jgi:HAMP domain-containing protein
MLKDFSLLSLTSDLAKIQWRAQFFANIFFGLPLIILTLFYVGLSWLAILKVLIVYLLIYSFIYLPFHWLFPFWRLFKLRMLFSKIQRGEKLINSERELLINYLFLMKRQDPFIIFGSVWLGFWGGIFILSLGFIRELMSHFSILALSGLIIGFGVAVIEAFLNYNFFEIYLKRILNRLISLDANLIFKEIKIKKTPLFFKIFLLVLFSTLSAQLALSAIFIFKISVIFPQDFWKTLMVILANISLILFYTSLIALVFARNLTFPLGLTVEWLKEVLENKSQRPLNLITDDEISELLGEIKRLVEKLQESKGTLETKIKERTQELQALTHSLEEKVRERTKELQQKLEELERFQRIAIGRELKMKELKEEIARLKTLLLKVSANKEEVLKILENEFQS